MSRRLSRRRAALDDLADQAAWYIAHASQEVADRFLAAVERELGVILAVPDMGSSRAYANPALAGLRMAPVRGFETHLVFYLPTEEGIELVRVLHGARDIDAIMKAEPSEAELLDIINDEIHTMRDEEE